MERLKLTCGRYIPAGNPDDGARLAALEEYVSRLSVELEFRLGEAGRALDELTDAITAAEAISAADAGEEGAYE